MLTRVIKITVYLGHTTVREGNRRLGWDGGRVTDLSFDADCLLCRTYTADLYKI